MLPIVIIRRVWLINPSVTVKDLGRDGRWLRPIPLDCHDIHHVEITILMIDNNEVTSTFTFFVLSGAGLDKMCAGSLVENRSEIAMIFINVIIVIISIITNSIIIIITMIRYILTAGHCVRYCEPSTLPNCTRRVPFAQLTFKVI